MTDALHYKDESQKYYIKQENPDIQYVRHDSLYKVQERAKLNYEDENLKNGYFWKRTGC